MLHVQVHVNSDLHLHKIKNNKLQSFEHNKTSR